MPALWASSRSRAGLCYTGVTMQDGTRLIFWLDVLILVVIAFLVLAQQWDFVIALFVALVVMNYFDHWASRRRR